MKYKYVFFGISKMLFMLTGYLFVMGKKHDFVKCTEKKIDERNGMYFKVIPKLLDLK
jgi:hypothetical protein